MMLLPHDLSRRRISRLESCVILRVMCLWWSAKAFYGEILGLSEGRSSTKWQDYDLYGNQLVVHCVGDTYDGRELDGFNPVDGDDVPVCAFATNCSRLRCSLRCCAGVLSFSDASRRCPILASVSIRGVSIAWRIAFGRHG